jgi:hypothetical protein
MPVTAGPVPGVTSDLRRVPMDPGRFRTGRWFVLAEGVLVSAFGVVGLVSASQYPHAGPTGAPVFGLASTAAHSGMLLAFGVAAIACVGNRRAAVTVTALSALAYTMLLFVGSVATAKRVPTLLGFHAADIVLHGVLAVVNLALLMWLIPDELGDETWVRRRGGRDRQQPSAPEAVTEPSAASPSMGSKARGEESGAHAGPPQPPPTPPAGVQPARTNEPPAHENSTQAKHRADRATDAAIPRDGVVPVAAALLAAVAGIVIWIRRR